MIDYRFIHIVTTDADGLGGGYVGQTHDGHLGSPSADIDNHRGGRVSDGQSGTDSSSHRFINQIAPASTGPFGTVDYRPAFDGSNPARHGDDHSRPDKPAPAVDFPDEIPQHGFGDFEIADYAVLERPDSTDRARCFP